MADRKQQPANSLKVFIRKGFSVLQKILIYFEKLLAKIMLSTFTKPDFRMVRKPGIER